MERLIRDRGTDSLALQCCVKRLVFERGMKRLVFERRQNGLVLQCLACSGVAHRCKKRLIFERCAKRRVLHRLLEGFVVDETVKFIGLQHGLQFLVAQLDVVGARLFGAIALCRCDGSGDFVVGRHVVADPDNRNQDDCANYDGNCFVARSHYRPPCVHRCGTLLLFLLLPSTRPGRKSWSVSECG